MNWIELNAPAHDSDERLKARDKRYMGGRFPNPFPPNYPPPSITLASFIVTVHDIIPHVNNWKINVKLAKVHNRSAIHSLNRFHQTMRLLPCHLQSCQLLNPMNLALIERHWRWIFVIQWSALNDGSMGKGNSVRSSSTRGWQSHRLLSLSSSYLSGTATRSDMTSLLIILAHLNRLPMLYLILGMMSFFLPYLQWSKYKKLYKGEWKEGEKGAWRRREVHPHPYLLSRLWSDL